MIYSTLALYQDGLAFGHWTLKYMFPLSLGMDKYTFVVASKGEREMAAQDYTEALYCNLSL